MFTCIGVVGLAVSSALFWSFKDHYKKKLDRSSAENMLAIARRKQTPNLVSSWSCTEDEPTLKKKISSLLLSKSSSSEGGLSQTLIEVPSIYHWLSDRDLLLKFIIILISKLYLSLIYGGRRKVRKEREFVNSHEKVGINGGFWRYESFSFRGATYMFHTING